MNDTIDPAPREPAQGGYLRIASVHGCAVDDLLMTDAMLRVLVALGSHATQRNDHWVCAKQSTIARRLGVSRQFISEQCLELEKLGYVSINAAYRADGGRTSNDVKLLLDFQLPPERLRSMEPRKKQGRGGRPKTPPPQLNEVAPPATLLSCTPRNSIELHPPQLPEVAPPATSGSCSSNREEEERSLRGKRKRARAPEGDARAVSSSQNKIETETPEPETPSPLPPSPALAESLAELAGSEPLEPGSIPPERLWASVVSELKRTETLAAIASWILPAHIQQYGWDADGVLQVILHTVGRAHADMLEQRYGYLICGAISRQYHISASHVWLSYNHAPHTPVTPAYARRATREVAP